VHELVIIEAQTRNWTVFG